MALVLSTSGHDLALSFLTGIFEHCLGSGKASERSLTNWQLGRDTDAEEVQDLAYLSQQLLDQWKSSLIMFVLQFREG